MYFILNLIFSLKVILCSIFSARIVFTVRYGIFYLSAFKMFWVLEHFPSHLPDLYKLYFICVYISPPSSTAHTTCISTHEYTHSSFPTWNLSTLKAMAVFFIFFIYLCTSDSNSHWLKKMVYDAFNIIYGDH